MMINIVIANMLTFLAMILGCISGTKKSKKEILVYQSEMQFCYIVSNILLKGYSGLVQNIIGFIRNISVIFKKTNQFFNYLLVIAGVLFGIYFNNKGLIGLLPVVGGLQYALIVVNSHSKAKIVKISMILNSLSFSIYSIALYNIVGVLTNFITAIITFLSLIREEKAF